VTALLVPEKQLYAYVHWAESGTAHLRIRQNFYHSDDFREAIRRVGTPAIWKEGPGEWDCPLTPAGVSVLKDVAEKFSVLLQWDPALQAYAKQQIDLDEYENRVRLAVEKTWRERLPLDPYVTNTCGGKKPPMRHQQVAYHWGLRYRGLLLAWDPGTGKTRGATDMAGGWYRHGIIRPMANYAADGKPLWKEIAQKAVVNPKTQAVVWHVERPGHWAVAGGMLVVCPKSVLRTWSRELALWQGMTSVEVTGDRKRKFKRAAMVCHAHIINYESLDVVSDNMYDAIIVDESHRCANKTIQTEKVLEIALRCKRVILLSGTPVSNTLESVFYQMYIVDGGRSLGANHQAFLDEFFKKEQKGPQSSNVAKEGSAEKIAARMARATFFCKKEEVADLPPKTHAPVFIEMTDDQLRYYEALKKETEVYIQDSSVTIELAAQRMMKLLQVCQGLVRGDDDKWLHFNSVKQDALIEDLTNELRGRKVVVWCRFTEEIQMLLQKLQRAGLWALRFDGDVAKPMRDRAIDAWNTDPRYTVFVGQISMGEGIELVAENCMSPCFLTYYLGLDYRYVSWQQSQDRIHRLTQKYSCYYKYLLTPNGVDHGVYKALLAKENTALTVHKTGKDYYLSLLRDDTPNLEAL
jgi:hypothetical protein